MYTILLRSFVKKSRGNNSRVWNHKIYAKSWGLNKFAEEGIVELIPIERERIKALKRGIIPGERQKGMGKTLNSERRLND